MTGLPISTIVLTYNEENTIGKCLKSVHGWVDEILVVDSYSTDSTLEIARNYTDKIYQHPFGNYARQRNWAQENLPIRNEWTFHLDADEVATAELIGELKDIFTKPINGVDGFLVSRGTVFMGRRIKHGGLEPVYHLRVFRRSSGRCEERLYDQHFYVTGKVTRLRGEIINTVTSDLDTWIARHNRWAHLETQEVTGGEGSAGCHRAIKGRRKGNPIERKRWLREQYYRLPLFIRPSLYFLYRYFFRLGFLDGKEGLVYHVLQAFWYRFLVDAKIYEYRRKLENAD
jgi:glycosyltransferase involved in cell wall biosynthesis